ncbi:MAG: hypothetical protein PHN88_07045 [Ignavibacteria bacterium]|nr:hypothetical protein [Ignavibacteria bacterium]
MSKEKKKEVKHNFVAYTENPYFNYALVGIFFIFLVFFTTFKITGDDDVFWHLATGRYILGTGHVPSTDIFGFLTQGQTWMPFEWGWDVISYLTFKISGYTGLSVLRTLIFLSIFSLLYHLLRKFNVSVIFSIISLFTLSFAIIDRLTPRPHMLSYLFFVLLLYIICRYRYFNRGSHKVLYFIPLIFLLWANIHMGIIAGGFIMFLYFISEFINTFYNKSFSNSEIRPLDKKELLRLFIILAVSAMVMLVNPNFFQTYVYAFEHTKMKMLETVNEWMSPFGSRTGDGFVNILYKLLLFSGVLTIYYSFKKKDVFPAILYIGFALYSVRAMRFTVDYVIILFPFVFVALNLLFESLKSENVKTMITKKPGLKVAMGLFLIFIIIKIPDNELYLNYLKYYRVTGVGINSDFIPTQLFDFMKNNDIPNIGGRVFNHFGTGGFFVWNFEGKQNFIDSRNLNDDIFNKYQQILSKRPGFEQKLDEYNIEYAIYLAPDLVRDPKEMDNTVISYFCKSANWKLLFWDDKSFLWVRNIPKFKDLIDKYEYSYFSPYTFVYQKSLIEKGINENPDKLKAEISRKKDETPQGIVLNSFLASYGKKLNY